MQEAQEYDICRGGAVVVGNDSNSSGRPTQSLLDGTGMMHTDCAGKVARNVRRKRITQSSAHVADERRPLRELTQRTREGGKTRGVRCSARFWRWRIAKKWRCGGSIALSLIRIEIEIKGRVQQTGGGVSRAHLKTTVLSISCVSGISSLALHCGTLPLSSIFSFNFTPTMHSCLT